MPDALESAAAVAKGYKGRIVDLVTLETFDIRYEPDMKDTLKASWGFHSVFGNVLPTALWAGGGEKQVTVDIYLLGGTMQANAPVSAQEVGTARMDQLANYQRQILVEVVPKVILPDGTPKMHYIQNPVPPPKPLSALEAKQAVSAKKKSQSMGVLPALQHLERLVLPQDDIGAPHPIMLSVGTIYANTKFVVEELSRQFLSYALDSQVPYEAKVTLKLREVQFDGNKVTK